MSEQATAEPTAQVALTLPVLRKVGPGLDGRVRRLQHMLNVFLYGLAEDGWFGPKTEEAVKWYQGNENLFVDGIVGRQTYTKLVSYWLSGDRPD
jgi:peptidoglycan hydrolase-like protein with peptidoglycan-binding domain